MSLIELEKYMLTNEYISQHSISLLKPITKCNFFTPKQKDTLFWCFYIIKYGMTDYDYIGNISFTKEKEEKFKLIDFLRLNIRLLKEKKMKNIKEDIEDELANKEIINMKTFISLCIVYKFNILFIHNRKCYNLLSMEGDPYHVIHYITNNSVTNNSIKNGNGNKKTQYYSYELNASQEKLEHYKNTYFNWECINKPLKSITAYKLEELVEICKKMDLQDKMNELSKINKKDVYELLVMNI